MKTPTIYKVIFDAPGNRTLNLAEGSLILIGIQIHVEKLLETYHDRDPGKRENIILALREISNNAIGWFVEEAKEVCANTAMAGAGDYNSISEDPKPLLFVSEDDSVFEPVAQNLNMLHVDWLLYKRDDLQVVVCLQSEKDWLQTCSYHGGGKPIKRIKRRLNITLHEAATGLVIDDFVLIGEEPSSCPYSVGANSRTTEYIGEIPNIYDAILENLKNFGFDIKY